MSHLNIVVIDRDWEKIGIYRMLKMEFSGSKVTFYPDHHPLLADHSAEPPDIVVLDADTSRLDATSLARRLKRRAHGLPPIVLVMGAQTRRADQARAGGVDVFMQKPISSELFMELIHDAIKLRSVRASMLAASSAGGRQ